MPQLAHVPGVLAAASVLLVAGCSSPTMATQPPVLEVIASTPISVDITAGVTGTQNIPGQSVYISPGVYSNLRFHWYRFNQEPSAFGTLYLLSEEFLGNPADLHGAHGLIARTSRVEHNEFIFDTELRVTGNRTYWFYSDSIGPFVSSAHDDTYPIGVGYISNMPLRPFRYQQPATGPLTGLVDSNFRLRAFRR